MDAIGENQTGFFGTSPGHVPGRNAGHQRDRPDNSLEQGWVPAKQAVQVLVDQGLLTLHLLVVQDDETFLDSLEGQLDLPTWLARLLQKLLESGLAFEVDLLSLADHASLDEDDRGQVSRVEAQLIQVTTGSDVLLRVLE